MPHAATKQIVLEIEHRISTPGLGAPTSQPTWQPPHQPSVAGGAEVDPVSREESAVHLETPFPPLSPAEASAERDESSVGLAAQFAQRPFEPEGRSGSPHSVAVSGWPRCHAEDGHSATKAPGIDDSLLQPPQRRHHSGRVEGGAPRVNIVAAKPDDDLEVRQLSSPRGPRSYFGRTRPQPAAQSQAGDRAHRQTPRGAHRESALLSIESSSMSTADPAEPASG